MGKKAKLALIVPRLIELITVFDQLEQLGFGAPTRDDLIDAISAYGVDLEWAKFDYAKLQAVLDALDTVGGQLRQCFSDTATLPTATPTAAATAVGEQILSPEQTIFRQVFPSLTFLYDENKDYADTNYNETTGGITITLAPSTFFHCVAKFEDPPDGVNLPTIRPHDLPCAGEDIKSHTNVVKPNGEEVTLTYHWEQEPFSNRQTSRAIIRHEIGHGFLDILINEHGFTQEAYYEMVGTLEDDLMRFNDQETPPFRNQIESFYFPNATGKTHAPDWTEDFADVFSLMGRFSDRAKGIDVQDVFVYPQVSPSLLAETTRYNKFDKNFCCWLGQIIDRLDLCQQRAIPASTATHEPESLE